MIHLFFFRSICTEIKMVFIVFTISVYKSINALVLSCLMIMEAGGFKPHSLRLSKYYG